MFIQRQPWFRKTLVTIAGKPKLAKFIKASKDVRSAQKSVLEQIIADNRNTAFGRDHGFDKITDEIGFRKAVPIRNFEGHRPYVDRMVNGEADVLCSGKPLFYTNTSGTTTKPKYIPVYAGYFARYNEMSKIWLYSVMKDNPSLYNGQSLSYVAPAEEGRLPDGTPYGSISGVTYRNIPKVLKSTYSAPYPLMCIKDFERKYYALVRAALGTDTTFIISASPSNVLRMHEVALANWESILRDIRDGTMRHDVAAAIEPELREEALAGFKPDKKRTVFLEKMMREHGQSLRPKHYWPHLACVNIWKQGSFTVMLPRLDGYLPQRTSVREFGYWASEFRGGLVLGNNWEHSVLTAHAHYFEFIEESARAGNNPAVLSCDELEVGRRYFVICTNGSGLYRYDINDIVEVTGRLNRFPLIRFIRRGEGETDITGEKLSEPQVVEAVQNAAKNSGTGIEFFTMICDQEKQRYLLFVEFKNGTPGESKVAFASIVDKLLVAYNYEYDRKRGTGRLKPPELVELTQGSYEKLKQDLCSSQMAIAGQYKDVYLRYGSRYLKFFMALKK